MFFLVGLLLLINLYIYWKAFVVFINSVHYYFNYLLSRYENNEINNKWVRFMTLFKLNQIKFENNKKSEHRDNFKESIEKINSQEHFIFWNNLKKYDIIFFNLNIKDQYNLEDLFLFCKKNEKQLILIGDEKPTDVEELLKECNFDKKNYLSPYNYSKNIFNYVVRNSLGVMSEFPNDEVKNDKNIIIDEFLSQKNISKDEIIYINDNNIYDLKN